MFPSDIFHIRTTPLATSFRRIFYLYYYAMKCLCTIISLSIFSANPAIKRKTEFLISLTKTNCLGKLKAQDVIIFLENNLKVYRFYLNRGPNVWKSRQFWEKKNSFWLPISLVSANIILENSLGYFLLLLFVNRSSDFQIYGTFYDIVGIKYW